MSTRPFWLAGTAATGDTEITVVNPYTGEDAGTVSVPTAEQIEEAVAAAHAVAAEAAALPAHVRADALDHVSRRIGERAEEIARTITAESGKPIKWARAEAGRAVSVFRWAAEEARRDSGELQRLDTDPGGTGRMALVRRVPKGPVLGISPFNFPLNLVAHKVAPAIAVGAPIILKPAPATPMTALLLGEIIAETDLPGGMVSVLPMPNELAAPLITDERLPVISFTGGPFGWQLPRLAPHKHVTLELGGNAAAVVLADADLDWAAQRVALFGNNQAGQVCIGVQRVIVEDAVYDEFVPRLVERVEALGVGDPADPATDVGPLVDEAAAERVASWIDEAVTAGAKLLTGGTRDGVTVAPTVLAEAPDDSRVVRQEVFGPVLVLQRAADTDAAFAAVNDSDFGLQAGVFTRDLPTAFRAHRELEVGGVVIGDVPTFRADQMPYGGVKGSGVGKEGVRAAMTDLSYERVLVLTGIDL
ncbi:MULTISPECIES: aldehyde dehydrogenase family protein [Nocardiopsis]|uniref:Aldehyde Dehydrogenase n=1 Tax=Nocardiopsis dassonvillei (strain ATCC 23218 / DSM 43111 / CIP 107115 / JCM 7437 / KCTC 9190 / NBRC 14626 / NCTC 10488 / NRRL B-5397 / IMRU 509) TaxID=446468 RepID=D7B507_NOCDD|nr:MULTISPECIES: aldehyde dehydrogenase family protein [Nocardiopsis]ADH69028.1 Aldehyde Dehydrogenase [Nocardiopsis dassonvillei subsp. dassonvillei DSM 43111]APC37070.1 aldehyde dehydrogenase [Nocardiopsis dassonvillei]NKY79553.1 aldehyde dehydrogenase family protein [Nocardiopsis dassonvillei]VEI89537.1 NADP-dependent glyceraldehyde-3-phosphate dehydrogenase [Nocardiopsis dassonvillei]